MRRRVLQGQGLARGRVWGLVAGLVIFSLLLTLLGGVPLSKTPLWQTPAALLGVAGQEGDSWDAMGAALRLVRYGELVENKSDSAADIHSRGAQLYQTLFFDQGVKFQYPPTALLVLEPVCALTAAPSQGCLSGDSWKVPLNRLSWLCVWLLGGLSWAMARRAARGTSAQAEWSGWRGLLPWLAFTWTFYPVARGLNLGQIQPWLNALFGLALLAWCDGRPRLTGVALALMTLIKPQYGLLLGWGLLRRQWQCVAAFGLILAVGGGLSLARYGVSAHLTYLEVLSYISHHGEAFLANQSVNGLAHRFLQQGSILTFSPRAFAPDHAGVYVLTLLTSSLLILPALLLPAWRGGRASVTELCLLGLSLTLASPVAWEHHFGLLVPILAWLVAQPEEVQGRRARGWRWLSALAAGVSLPVTVWHGGLQTLYTAPLFCGALGLLVWLWQTWRLEGQAVSPLPSPPSDPESEAVGRPGVGP